MIGHQKLSKQTLIDYLKTYYGIKVAAMELLSIGADTNASVYKVQAQDSSCYFVKLKYGHFDATHASLLELLYRSGIQQIIPPFKTIQGDLMQSADHVSLLVYPYVEGESGFNRRLTNDQWFTLGKILRRVHDFNLPLSMQAKLKTEAYTDKWRKIVRSYYINPALSPYDDLALKFTEFMKNHRLTIQHLVEKAELLSKEIQKKSPEFVLCHSDIHGGNVLIDKIGQLYIVDWDEPIRAPKERDLMFIGGGVANVWNKPEEENFFYEGYGKTEIDRSILAYYRFERIVEDIAIYSLEIIDAKASLKEREEMYQHFLNMFHPNGVIDIAFKTNF